MRATFCVFTLTACCLSTGCTTLAGFNDVSGQQLSTLSNSKTAYLEKIKQLDCVAAGVIDLNCYEMKKAAKDGFEDAFVDTGNGVYVLDPMKLEYLKGLEKKNSPPPALPKSVKSAQSVNP